MSGADRQENIDTFYHATGPCCAGCDWWRHLNSLVGECMQSRIVSANERFAMIGVQKASLNAGAGHAVTLREHRCGKFKDDFDWRSLPLSYQRRIGYRALNPADHNPGDETGHGTVSRSQTRDDH